MARDVRKKQGSARLKSAPTHTNKNNTDRQSAAARGQVNDAITRLEGKFDKLTGQFGQLIEAIQQSRQPDQVAATRASDSVSATEHKTLDGKPDERFAENRIAKEPRTEDSRENGSRRSNFSGEKVDEEGRHYTKEGKPDHRFAEFRGESSNDDNRPRPPTSEYPASIQHVREKGGKIELNNATTDDLIDIPMMGKGRAKTIVQFRELKHGFKSWDDLEGIPGISQGMLANLQELCTINGKSIEDEIGVDRDFQDTQSTRRGPGRPRKEEAATQGSSVRPQAIDSLVDEFIQNAPASQEEKEVLQKVLARISTRPPSANDDQ